MSRGGKVPTLPVRPAEPSELRALAGLFLKLGVIGVGGPAAHIALMEEEVVRRRGWFTRQEFLDLLGLVNLLPGPNSTELALLIGRRRAGGPGLLVAGLCFILPAAALVLAAAWAYVRFGRVPAVQDLWAGVKPVVLAVVAIALVGLARTAARTRLEVAIGLASAALAALGAHELLVLLLAGAVSAGWRARRPPAAGLFGVAVPVLPAILSAGAASGLGALFLYFLKIGAVLYGSGYVLLAFLRGELVERTARLTEGQLLDAVAVGQVTPGPVFTTATFIGYLLHGVPGAAVATVGIFLPAFVLIALAGRLEARLLRAPGTRAFLDGVNAGSLALMAVVTWHLSLAALDGVLAVLLAAGALVLLRLGANSALLILAGAAAGLLLA